MSDDQDPKERKVGYKNPPVESRFKPGQSGNPSGRPKKKLTPMVAFFAELDKPIVVKEGGKKRRMTREQALLMKTYSDAMAGDPSSRRFMYSVIERRSASAATTAPVDLSADDEAILQAFLEKQRGGEDE